MCGKVFVADTSAVHAITVYFLLYTAAVSPVHICQLDAQQLCNLTKTIAYLHSCCTHSITLKLQTVPHQSPPAKPLGYLKR